MLSCVNIKKWEFVRTQKSTIFVTIKTTVSVLAEWKVLDYVLISSFNQQESLTTPFPAVI